MNLIKFHVYLTLRCFKQKLNTVALFGYKKNGEMKDMQKISKM